MTQEKMGNKAMWRVATPATASQWAVKRLSSLLTGMLAQHLELLQIFRKTSNLRAIYREERRGNLSALFPTMSRLCCLMCNLKKYLFFKVWKFHGYYFFSCFPYPLFSLTFLLGIDRSLSKTLVFSCCISGWILQYFSSLFPFKIYHTYIKV